MQRHFAAGPVRQIFSRADSHIGKPDAPAAVIVSEPQRQLLPRIVGRAAQLEGPAKGIGIGQPERAG